MSIIFHERIHFFVIVSFYVIASFYVINSFYVLIFFMINPFMFTLKYAGIPDPPVPAKSGGFMKENKKYNNYNDLLGEYPVAVSFIDLTKVNESVHWHDSMEINIVNNGTVEVLTNDGSLLLNAGEGILLAPSVVHSLRAATPDQCTLYVVHFSPAFLFTYEQPYLGNKYRDIVLSAPELKSLILREGQAWDDEVLDTINNLIAANLTKKYGYELVSRGMLSLFWALLLKKVDPVDSPASKALASLDSERVKTAIIFMEEHYADPISLDDIADHIHISKSECCRCFKRSLRLTPFEYLMKYRIYIASSKIIEDPDLKSISDLGFSVGFNNSSYFNKIFRQFMNCTPTEYKKKVKAASINSQSPNAFIPYRF